MLLNSNRNPLPEGMGRFNIPSPSLIIGDQYLSKNNIVAIKRKYGDYYRLVTISATSNSIEELRSEAAIGDFLSQPKIMIINDLPNQKAVREAILELVAQTTDSIKFIVWDSSNSIRLDPKTKEANKTWSEFIKRFEKIPNSKIVNNGADFTEKDDADCIDFVKSNFEKRKKQISSDLAKIFVSIVGRDRGLLVSEIEKISLTSEQKITQEYIMQNVFPTSKEAILYKFGNALDGDYGQAISMLEQFLDIGINANVLAEIMAKKARWQLAACHLYSKGMAWYDVDKNLVSMGKFPSCVWQSNLSYDQKQKISQECETEEGLKKYIDRTLGLPEYYFSSKKKSSKSKKKEDEEDSDEDSSAKTKSKVSILGKKEILPMPFMATQITSALNNNFVRTNASNIKPEVIREKLLDHSLNVYLGVIENLKNIRYNDDSEQSLYEMVRLLTNRVLSQDEK